MNSGLRGAKILLVDDDESFRPAFQKSLESLGHCVTAAANGVAGKEAFLANSFDLVISDIRMPEMDGIELTRFIKNSQKPLPVILITGFSEIIETQQAYDLGADEFLAKPIDRDELDAALDRNLRGVHAQAEEDELTYCKLGIDDFICGRQIEFNIFIQLSPVKYIKVAHKGEDLSIDRIRAYKYKGVSYLYLRHIDFKTYVGLSIALSKAAGASRKISREKKLNLLRHTGEVIQEQLQHEGVDQECFDGSVAFVQTAVEVLCEDPDVMELLEVMNNHADYLYAHSVGVSLYSVMLARSVSWNLPTNRIKVAISGLFHDIGEKEITRELFSRPRASWGIQDVQLYESHSKRGVEILSGVKTIPDDVIQIVKEHHENCLGTGFPSRIKRSVIHPMAKLVAVADEFCDRVIKSPNNPGVPPKEALRQMVAYCSDSLDPEFFAGLMRLFQFTPNDGPGRAEPQRIR